MEVGVRDRGIRFKLKRKYLIHDLVSAWRKRSYKFAGLGIRSFAHSLIRSLAPSLFTLTLKIAHLKERPCDLLFKKERCE